MPAGGEYLQYFLPSSITYLGFDPSSGFNSDRHESCGMANLPFADQSIDALVSLAGLHHCTDKRPFLNACHHALVPRGLSSVLDVRAGSPEARLLDEFVGEYNGMGHQGDYLGPEFVLQCDTQHWEILAAGMVDCHWQFVSKNELCDFCRGLFRLQNVSNTTILDAVARYLNFRASMDSRDSVQMPWRLYRVVARKRLSNQREH